MKAPPGPALIEPEACRRIRRTAADYKEAMVALLEELATIESPSTDPALQRRVQARLADELEAIGYRVRLHPGRDHGGILLARPRDRTPGRSYQIVLGHTDTVWPVGTLASMPVETRDGALHGPGVFDDKGGLVQAVFALRIVTDLGLAPEVTPVLLFNSDEEIGSGDSRRWIERLARGAARALVVEPALGPEGRIKTARKGGSRFEVRIRGRSAHAGLDPAAGASAIVELARVVQSLHALNEPDRGVSVNVGVIEGGVRSNVVAATSRALVDVRAPALDDLERVEGAIRAITPSEARIGVEVERLRRRPPLERTPRNRALWHDAREVGACLGLDLEEGIAGGGSDGCLTSPFTATLDGLGPVGDGAHADHEHVVIDRMPERAALLAGLLLLPEAP